MTVEQDREYFLQEGSVEGTIMIPRSKAKTHKKM
jgi:hypothetical protein